MSRWLKAYEWEQETWPDYRRINIDREQQKKYLRILSRHFKTTVPSIRQSLSRGAAYFSYFEVIKFHKEVCLGTLIHEYAHHLNWKKYEKRGHRKSFKKCLTRVYRWADRHLLKQFLVSKV